MHSVHSKRSCVLCRLCGRPHNTVGAAKLQVSILTTRKYCGAAISYTATCGLHEAYTCNLLRKLAVPADSVSVTDGLEAACELGLNTAGYDTKSAVFRLLLAESPTC